MFRIVIPRKDTGLGSWLTQRVNRLTQRAPCLGLCMFSLLVAGCTQFQPTEQVLSTCSARVYVNQGLADQLQTSKPGGAPLRFAIIPFSAPSNLSGANNELPGIGNDLAWKIHAEALASGQFPVVEVFNRQDWPRKKEEFFTGNFGALDIAEAAGYDLVLVGVVDPLKTPNTLVAHAKVINIHDGVTIWYGKISSGTREFRTSTILDSLYKSPDRPDITYFVPLMDELSRCMIAKLLATPRLR